MGLNMKRINFLIRTLLEWAQNIGLMIIAICQYVCDSTEVIFDDRFAKSIVGGSVADVYLSGKVLAMVSMYLESGKNADPNSALYCDRCIGALPDHLDMKSMDAWQLVGVKASAFLLAVTVLVIRYGKSASAL